MFAVALSYVAQADAGIIYSTDASVTEQFQGVDEADRLFSPMEEMAEASSLSFAILELPTAPETPDDPLPLGDLSTETSSSESSRRGSASGSGLLCARRVFAIFDGISARTVRPYCKAEIGPPTEIRRPPKANTERV